MGCLSNVCADGGYYRKYPMTEIGVNTGINAPAQICAPMLLAEPPMPFTEMDITARPLLMASALWLPRS